MTEIYYTSDFKIEEQGECYTQPFRFVYFCSGGSVTYDVEFDGETYHNCKVTEDGGLNVYFVNHNMGVGQLMVEKSFLRTNSDGTKTWKKINATRKDYLLTIEPITIKAVVVEEDGVEVSNTNDEIVRIGKERAVKLSGDFTCDVDNETVKLY